MNPSEESFQKHKEKSLESYIAWKKCFIIDVREPIIARQCAEHILKALVVKEKIHNIVSFDFNLFRELKRNNHIPSHITTFGGNACLHLIKQNRKDLLSKEIYDAFKIIIDTGNKGGHDAEDKSTMLKLANNIDHNLFEVSDWFFKKQIKDMHWEKESVLSAIKNIDPKEIAKQIALYLKEYLEEIRKNEIQLEESKIIIEHINNTLLKLDTLTDAVVEKGALKTEKIVSKHANKILETIREIENKKWRKILLISLPLIALLLTFYFLSAKYLPKTDQTRNETINSSIVPFDTSASSYNVLLFPFQPLENCQYKSDIERTIITRLQDMNELENLNLQVKFDSIACVRTYADADSIGRKLNANLVIWGDLYEHRFSDNKEACLKYKVIVPKNVVFGNEWQGESGIQHLQSLSQVREGKLQKEIDYIIYWIAGLDAYSKHNYIASLNHFRKIEKINITDDLYYEMAVSYYYLNSFDSAKSYLEKSFQINPDFANAHYTYAILMGDKFKKKEVAQEHFIITLQIDPNFIDAHVRYAILLYDKFNSKEKAKEHFEDALKLDSNNLWVHYHYAHFLGDKLKDRINATLHWEKLFQIPKKDARAHLAYGLCLFNWNEFEGGRGLFEKAIEISPDSVSLHRLFVMKYLEEALKKNNDNSILHYVYSCILTYDNNIIDAKKHYLEAIRLDPTLKNKEAGSYFSIR